ncbi:hypothetical protein [Saccharothrix longispora]|uniref:hypothetical protein n=1 Tax=Saccharothrix longispora TaxID=33920 RepID=UPI0028FD0598|nr:hypothetical protein [Saccharothrix longispora]MDU0290129.1 hypothetical protein [Saccharothrix longispora]
MDDSSSGGGSYDSGGSHDSGGSYDSGYADSGYPDPAHQGYGHGHPSAEYDTYYPPPYPGGGYHPGFQGGGRRRDRPYHPGDLSDAQPWVKVLTWLGTIVALIGFAIAGLAVLGTVGAHQPASDGDVVHLDGRTYEITGPGVTSPSDTTDLLDADSLRLGFGLFFLGAVLLVVAATGHSTSRRR